MYIQLNVYFLSGILHKGDGTNIYLKEKPKKIVNILGDGNNRDLNCDNCNGKASKSSLMSPMVLASGLDGSLYVGDYNIIRQLSPDREEVNSILRLEYVIFKFVLTTCSLCLKFVCFFFQSCLFFLISQKNSPKHVNVLVISKLC